MQVIHCTYHGPTNTRGSRIKATCDTASVTISYPHELSGLAVYRAAAEALTKKLGWTDPLVGGSLPKNNGYVFVLLNSAAIIL